MIEPTLRLSRLEAEYVAREVLDRPGFPSRDEVELPEDGAREIKRELRRRGVLNRRGPEPEVQALLEILLDSDREARAWARHPGRAVPGGWVSYGLFARGGEFVWHVEDDDGCGLAHANAEAIADLVAVVQHFETAGEPDGEVHRFTEEDMFRADGSREGDPPELAAQFVRERDAATHQLFAAIGTGWAAHPAPVETIEVHESDAHGLWVQHDTYGTPWWETWEPTIQRSNPDAVRPRMAALLERIREPLDVEPFRD